MIFIYGLLALALYLVLKLYKNMAVQPEVVWLELNTKKALKSRNTVTWWPVSQIINGLTQPGWFVKTFTSEDLMRRLDQQDVGLNTVSFVRLKQSIFTVAGAWFLIWIWFGSFSVESLFLWIGMWLLVTFLPDLYALQKLSRQNQKLSEDVPSFLDLLTLTLKSGVNLERALTITTQNFASPLSLVVAKKLKELDWGRSLEAVFNDLRLEIEDEDFKHFLNSVVRTKRLGVSLSETLSIQAGLLRTRRRQKAEELSRTASVKISVPLVLFVFPALLIIYIGPGILQLLART